MPWGVQEKLGGDPSTYMMVLEGEQELVRCEKLWFRRKKKNIGTYSGEKGKTGQASTLIEGPDLYM